MDKTIGTTLPTAQVEGVYHRRIGEAVVSSLCDGHMSPPIAVLQRITPEQIGAALAADFRADPPVLTVNTFVIRSKGRIALVDAGGGTIAPTVGRFARALAAAGVDGAEVDTVLLTHLHRDHVGGLVNPDGSIRFPNATLHAHQSDIDLWLDPKRAEGLNPALLPQFTIAAASLGPYGDRLQAFRGERELFPGVFSVELPGHAPGHCGFRVGAGAEALLIWGDVMHFPEIQSRHPDASLAFDWDGDQAIATRKRMLDMAATDRLQVAGMHMNFPGFAHIARHSGSYTVVQDVWTSAF